VLRRHLALSGGPPSFPLPSVGPTLRERRERDGHDCPSRTERLPGGSLPVAISNAIVGFLRDYTGRGPTKARTSIRDNVVVVMLEQTLTKGEQVLVDKGRTEQVLALRQGDPSST